MLFVAALDYEPNTDAIEWFVDKVLPLVRRRMSRAVVRVVGRGSEKVGWIADVPGVDLIGEVDEIRPNWIARTYRSCPSTWGPAPV